MPGGPGSCGVGCGGAAGRAAVVCGKGEDVLAAGLLSVSFKLFVLPRSVISRGGRGEWYSAVRVGTAMHACVRRRQTSQRGREWRSRCAHAQAPCLMRPSISQHTMEPLEVAPASAGSASLLHALQRAHRLSHGVLLLEQGAAAAAERRVCAGAGAGAGTRARP